MAERFRRRRDALGLSRESPRASRTDYDRRRAVPRFDHVVERVRAIAPTFCTRRQTYEDFLDACHRERIAVEVRSHAFDESFSRAGGEARIVLNAGLGPLYRTFVAFHALAHFALHPGTESFYLGTPGWLDAIELEASTVGYLALNPYPRPPYPYLVKARATDEQLEMWVDHPRVEPGGTTRWRQRRTMLMRKGQLAFDFGPDGQGKLSL